jgi:predicted phosphodiesterase
MTRLSHVLAAGMLLLLSWASVHAGSPEAMSVYRFWSPVLRSHFYTIDETEKARVLSQGPEEWTYEGVAFRAFASRPADGAMPVYRFWSPVWGSHFYTLDEAEKARALSRWPGVWAYEGVAFYAYPADAGPARTMPVYRFWSVALKDHFYTASDTERFTLLSSCPGVWDYETVAWCAYPPETAAVPVFTKGPWVQSVTSESAMILWQTDVAADSEVRCGVGALGTTAVSDPAATTLHRVVLTGLAPGAIYAYRATSGLTSQVGTFRTAPRPDQPFRLAVCGDTQVDPEVYRQIASGIVSSGADLVLHAGDLVSAGRSYGLWNAEFFGPASGLLQSAPVVPVLGNHEYGGAGPLWFFYFFERPLHEGWFAMTYGNCRLIGLDTNSDYSVGSPQYDWLVQELQSPACRAATWRIMIFHHPPFTSTAGHSDDVMVQRQLVPLFELYGVDLVFSGHSHAYERYLDHGIFYIVTGGGGGPLYELVPDVVPPIRQFGLSVHHYCLVDVDPRAGTLLLTAVDLNGRILDALKLSRPR